jgi:magnesium chelatase subunit D
LDKSSAALQVFAVAPHALGGARLRGGAGPQRDAWLQALRALLPGDMPWYRLPVHAADEALLGGLDLAATLASGKPVAERGLLARAAGGVVVAAMAERMSASLAARLAVELDGPAARLAVVALDEGADADEAPPAALLDRLALWVEPAPRAPAANAARVARARQTWHAVRVDDGVIEALVAAAAALGVDSSRAAWQALCVARIAAALEGREEVQAEDAALAAGLVLAPRATCAPPSDEPAPPQPPTPEDRNDEPPGSDDDEGDDNSEADRPLDDRVIAAAQAAIPAGLLALLAAGRTPGPRRGDAGRVGQVSASRQRGRPIGALRGEPRGGARLALIETLRAAAPWQRVRRAASGGQIAPGADAPAGRVHVTRDDLRVQRRVQHRATTTIFAIDASGSQALHRLAEAKGAVELLLADCYARRDRVAVIGFRGDGAQVLLAPTRSLVRAKRQLAGLPGGGGTPLAAGIDAAQALAAAVRRGGATPLVVLLTDGRANIARDGSPGREAATRDARSAARALQATATATLLIDTSPQPSVAAQSLAAELGARCVALPHAQAQSLSQAVRQERGRG